MTPTRWATRFIVLGILAAANGLDLPAQSFTKLDGRDTIAIDLRDITGTWQGTFSLDSAWRLPNRSTAKSIPARIHFNPVGDATPTTSSSRSVHAGTFSIEFANFGFFLSTQEALGWSVNADSMRATLNPTVNHGLVEVHGAFRGDTIVGTWRYVADPGGASGTFELRKAGA
jgi:hypothetical protein